MNAEMTRTQREELYKQDSEKTDQLFMQAVRDLMERDIDHFLGMFHSDLMNPQDIIRFLPMLKTESGKVYLTVTRYSYSEDKGTASFRVWASEPHVQEGHPNRSSNTIATSVADPRDVEASLRELSKKMLLIEKRDINKGNGRTSVLESTLYVFQPKEV